jgi:hypothetical protein
MLSGASVPAWRVSGKSGPMRGDLQTSNIDHLMLSHFIGATTERRLPNGNYFGMMRLE